MIDVKNLMCSLDICEKWVVRVYIVMGLVVVVGCDGLITPLGNIDERGVGC